MTTRKSNQAALVSLLLCAVLAARLAHGDEYAAASPPALCETRDPVVVITNAPPALVGYDLTALTIAGTNGPAIVGGVWWSNALTLAAGAAQVSSFEFHVSNIGLGVGANMISVFGTNVVEIQTNASVTITRGDIGTGAPFVDITNATPPILSYDVTSFTLGITNNIHVVGTRRWTNALTRATGVLVNNQATIPFGVGANEITVTGTNEWNIPANDTVTITRGDIGTGAPFVDITNATPPILSYDVTSFTLGITNNVHVVGTRTWTNTLTSASGVLVNNQATIPLGVGANLITVTGTNVYGDVSSDSVTIVRDQERTPPVIAPDALVFPGTNGALLEAGVVTAIVWRVAGIWDNADGTNLLLPSIAILTTNNGAVVMQPGTNVPNMAGLLAWTPWGLESETTAYVVRIEAVDSAGNRTNRVFFNNVFTVVPEPALFGIMAVLLWRTRHHGTVCKHF